MVTDRYGHQPSHDNLLPSPDTLLDLGALVRDSHVSQVLIPLGFEHLPRHFFEGEPRLAEVIKGLDLVPLHCNEDGTYLIMTPNPNPASGVFYAPGVCYKYVVQHAGLRKHGGEQQPLFSSLDEDWQRIMLRGLENQRKLGDVGSVQRVISHGFVLGIPGLVQLEYVQGETWEQRYNLDKSSDLVGRGEHTTSVSLHLGAILKDAKQVYHRIVGPMGKRGYAHRDLNPANVVFRERDDEPIAIDLSTCVDRAQYGQDLVDHRLIGTWTYLSPEQRSFGELDNYALGVSVLRLAFPYVSNRALREHRDDYRAILAPHLSLGDQIFMDQLFARSELEDTLETPKIVVPVSVPSPVHQPVRGHAWEIEPTAENVYALPFDTP